MTTLSPHPIEWLRAGGQRLGLVPSLGGGVAAWQLETADGELDLWRPWDGSPDMYRLASFAMMPWTNRISGGGFEQDGVFHPMQPNRIGEPYPIHGDGWLQPWHLERPDAASAVMTLESHRFGGGPYAYRAAQTFHLTDAGLEQAVEVTHLGAAPLPYGLGLHPWFPRTPGTRITAPVEGVWLCGADPLPTVHTREIPADWDLNGGAPAHGSFVDNVYTEWGGTARIEWPERGCAVEVVMPDFEADGGAARHYCLMYRPSEEPAFCWEPVTQPIDAFHVAGRPGLEVLRNGETLTLRVRWQVVRSGFAG